jgi:hypothetical protein
MIIPRRFCSYGASSLIHGTDLRRCLTTPLVHDQVTVEGAGGRSERGRGASDRNSIGAGLRALLPLVVSTTFTELVCGATGFGVKLHCAPVGIPCWSTKKARKALLGTLPGISRTGACTISNEFLSFA